MGIIKAVKFIPSGFTSDVTAYNGDTYAITVEGGNLVATLTKLAPPPALDPYVPPTLSGETTPKEISVTVSGGSCNTGAGIAGLTKMFAMALALFTLRKGKD